MTVFYPDEVGKSEKKISVIVENMNVYIVESLSFACERGDDYAKYRPKGIGANYKIGQFCDIYQKESETDTRYPHQRHIYCDLETIPKFTQSANTILKWPQDTCIDTMRLMTRGEGCLQHVVRLCNDKENVQDDLTLTMLEAEMHATRSLIKRYDINQDNWPTLRNLLLLEYYQNSIGRHTQLQTQPILDRDLGYHQIGFMTRENYGFTYMISELSEMEITLQVFDCDSRLTQIRLSVPPLNMRFSNHVLNTVDSVSIPFINHKPKILYPDESKIGDMEDMVDGICNVMYWETEENAQDDLTLTMLEAGMHATRSLIKRYNIDQDNWPTLRNLLLLDYYQIRKGRHTQLQTQLILDSDLGYHHIGFMTRENYGFTHMISELLEMEITLQVFDCDNRLTQIRLSVPQSNMQFSNHVLYSVDSVSIPFIDNRIFYTAESKIGDIEDRVDGICNKMYWETEGLPINRIGQPAVCHKEVQRNRLMSRNIDEQKCNTMTKYERRRKEFIVNLRMLKCIPSVVYVKDDKLLQSMSSLLNRYVGKCFQWNMEPFTILFKGIKQHTGKTETQFKIALHKLTSEFAHRENKGSLSELHIWQFRDSKYHRKKTNEIIKDNFFDIDSITKFDIIKLNKTCDSGANKYKTSNFKRGNSKQSLIGLRNEYKTLTGTDCDDTHLNGNETNGLIQDAVTGDVKPFEGQITDTSTEHKFQFESDDKCDVKYTIQQDSDSPASCPNVDDVIINLPRNVENRICTPTCDYTIEEHASDPACGDTESAQERDSARRNNHITNQLTHYEGETESEESCLDVTNMPEISQNDHYNDNMVPALRDELNIQDRAGYEDHLEYVEMRNLNVDLPNQPYDSLVSIADSGYGSENGHLGRVISDLNSIRNGRRVTRQNCPICRYRRTYGNLPEEQQFALYFPDEEGDTSLMLAITFTEVHLAKCLIEQSPSPHHLDIHNRHYMLTALHHAVIAERSDIIRYLLAHGADPTAKDKDGNTALHIACALANNENIILIKALTVPLSCGLEYFRHAHLHNIPQETTIFNYDGETVLHRAAARGNSRAINFLIGPYFRINLNIQEATAGYTILHNAIIQANKDLIRHLLTLQDIEIEAETFSGQTPLELAQVYELQDIVVMLIAYGARVRDSTVTDLSDDDANSGKLRQPIPTVVASQSDCIEVNYETNFKEFDDHAACNTITKSLNITALTQDDSIVDVPYGIKHTDTKTNENTDSKAPKLAAQTTNVLSILHEEESEQIPAISFDVHQNSVMGCLNGQQGYVTTPTYNSTYAGEEEGFYDEDRDMLLISGMSVALRGQYDFW